MPGPKFKHTTDRFTKQMTNIFNLMNTDFVNGLTADVPQTENLNKNFADKTTAQLIAFFKNGVNDLSNIDTNTIKRGANSMFNTGANAETLESDIASCITEIQKRANTFKQTTGYNRNEGRVFDYINSVIDTYNNIQTSMENMKEPFNRTDVITPLNDSVTDYETIQEEFTTALGDYSDLVNSRNFDMSGTTDEVKQAFNGASFSADSIFEKADINTLSNAVKNQVELEEAALSGLKNEMNKSEEDLKKEFAEGKAKIDRQCDSVINSQKQVFGQYKDGAYAEFDKLTATISAKRPDEATKKYEDNLKTLSSDENKNVTASYILKDEWTSGNKTQDELKAQSVGISKSIETLELDQKNISDQINSKKYQIASLKEMNKLFDQESDFTNDVTYKELKGEYDEINKNIEGMSNDINNLYLDNYDMLSKDFMDKYGLEFEPEDHTQRDKTVSDNLGKIYKEIGHGKVLWPERGKNLAKAVTDMHRIFVMDFQDMGIDPQNPDSPMPFEMSDELKNEFYDINTALINAGDDFGRFKNKNEVVCAAKLINRKDDIKAFSDSINPDAEEDPERKAMLSNMKKDSLAAYNALNVISNDKKVMDSLDKITEALQPSEKEKELKENVITALEGKKEILEENALTKDSEIYEYTHHAQILRQKNENQISNAERDIEGLENKSKQNQLDINYLKVSKEVCDEQLEKRVLSDNKEVAEKDLAALKQNAKVTENKHKESVAEIENKRKTAIGKLFDNIAGRFKKVKADYDKKIETQGKRVDSVKNFSEKLTNLNSKANKIIQKADTVGTKATVFDTKIADSKANLTAEHLEDLNNMSSIENSVIDQLKNTKRPFGNSDQFKDMMSALTEYQAAMQNPDPNMTKDQYNRLAFKARSRVETYVEARKTADGKKYTDVGQIRLDGAKKLLKMFDMKENQIKDYHTELGYINTTAGKQIKVGTEAEQVLIGKCQNQPECKTELITNRNFKSLVGDPNAKEILSSMVSEKEGANPTLVSKFNDSLEAFSKGNAGALTTAIAAASGINMLRGSNKEMNSQAANNFIESLEKYNCIKNCTDDVLSGDMKPSELGEYLKSQQFKDLLKGDIQASMPKAPENNKPQVSNEVAKEEVKEGFGLGK